MKHVSIDLETMGTKPYSAIIGIGAALFDPRGDTIIDSFHVTLDLELVQKRGFRLDASTVAWWLAPAQRPAWDAYLSIAHFSPDDAFNAFGQWLDTHGVRDEFLFWGNGAGFDNVLMHNAAELMGAEWHTKDGDAKPGFWPHWNDRCFRTLKSLLSSQGKAGAKLMQPLFEGKPHVAVDDAIHQARWMQNICKARDLNF